MSGNRVPGQRPILEVYEEDRRTTTIQAGNAPTKKSVPKEKILGVEMEGLLRVKGPNLGHATLQG